MSSRKMNERPRMHASTLSRAISLTIFMAVSSLAFGSAIADEIKPIREWSGVGNDPELAPPIPKDGVIQDQLAWQQFWKVWRPQEEAPQVDFEKNIIVVATTRGSNSVRIHRLNLAPGGNLQYSLAISRTRKPGFGFAMIELPGSSIKQINGRVLENGRALEPEPAGAKDSIEIEVVGVVKTGIMAIGGESTGVTITSDGATFELDLKRFQTANPNGKRARVSGRLIFKNGVEVDRRMIVEVAKIDIFDANKPVGNSKPAFGKIEILQSGGIAGVKIQTVVAADGKVTRVNERARVTETFELKEENLKNLHALVRETDWGEVEIKPPPVGAADAFQYSIAIETDTKTHRFDLSGLSIRKSKPLSELIGEIRNQ